MDSETAKCSFCGEDLVHEDEENASQICDFCEDQTEEGYSKEETIRRSKKERELSKYQDDVKELAEEIAYFLFDETKMSKNEQRDMSKRDIEKYSFHKGVFMALFYILRQDAVEPGLFRKILDSKREKFRKVLEGEGKNKEQIDELMKSFDMDEEEKMEYFRKEGFDVEKLRNYSKPLKTAEDFARFFNEVMFGGDWQKQLEWAEMHVKEGKEEDIALIKRLMEEERRKAESR